VTFYPACAELPANVRVPLTIFDGDADRIAPAGPCAALAKAATTAGQSVQITTYQGATHGFVVPAPDGTFDGQPVRYDAEAAADAARQTAAFLRRYLDTDH
jgi:dienelactone hydrolase